MSLPPPPPATTLALLRAQPRRAHEASFFFQDAGFARAAVKVLPGDGVQWQVELTEIEGL